MQSINGEHELAQPTAAGQASRLTFEQMARAVRAADPAALLVLPRILRRVIKQHRDLGGFAYRVPHRKSYVIDRDTLLKIADHWELDIGEHEVLPERVILIARPNPRNLATMTAQSALTRCWRLLFHARVHLALEEQAAAGKLGTPAVRRRMLQLGLTEFDEIRNVLRQEGMLLPPHNDRNVYIEFAATYLELRHFAPGFLKRFFPALEDLAAVDRMLAEDVDAKALFRVTRLRGAPEPSVFTPLDGDEEIPSEGDVPGCESLPPAEPSESRYRRFLRRAQRPAAVGNVVGAAIYRARAARYAPPEAIAKTQAAVKTDIAHLVDRLRSALDLHDQHFHAWQDALLALAAQTPRGIWTAEARLLYDLQKACVDHERDLYTVGVVEWALSLGRRPLKRPLPNQREVLLCKHLRSAARRLPTVRIADGPRRQLKEQLDAAIERSEGAVRERLRPPVTGVLDEVGLLPHNAVERVSRNKLVEELLDHIVERGYLTFGDLRDAISRNHVKLPDVSGPRDLWYGDALLRADRRLAIALDGVYRRGEIYMRWMQAFSSLGFGTHIGRFLTKYLVVPFGGAAVTAVFLDYIVAEITRAPKKKGAILHVFSGDTFWLMTCLLGAFLFGLMHARWFRRLVANALKGAWRVLRWTLIDPLVWLTRSVIIQAVLRSRLSVLAWRFALLPGAITAGTIGHWPFETTTAVAVFLAVNLLLNSRVGRGFQEMAADSLVQGWHNYGVRLLAGLFHLLLDFFRAILEWTERGLYTVDEWLRFKSGEGRFAFVGKAALSVIWFWITYVVRFTVNVLVEPQVNPIKHFPVVTVSHKLLFAAYYPFTKFLERAFNISVYEAGVAATLVIWCIPGIFGFLAWELRENWRLYAANRPNRLRRVIIGSHGESMLRLLRPGFHSGTIPKRFARLRRAERRAREKGGWKAARKQLEVLHHVERDVRRFVEREFAAWFAESRSWPGAVPAVEKVRLATNRVRVALKRPAVSDGTLWLTFEAQSGWLLADVRATECTGCLSPHQRQVLINALLGLYKTAAVELVRQQVENELRAPVVSYHCDNRGLVLWPDESLETEVRYDLRHDGTLAAPEQTGTGPEPDSVSSSASTVASSGPVPVFPTFDRTRLVFRETVIPWREWMAAWEAEQAEGGRPMDTVVPIRVLPSD
jgi:hypothetical protein